MGVCGHSRGWGLMVGRCGAWCLGLRGPDVMLGGLTWIVQVKESLGGCEAAENHDQTSQWLLEMNWRGWALLLEYTFSFSASALCHCLFPLWLRCVLLLAPSLSSPSLTQVPFLLQGLRSRQANSSPNMSLLWTVWRFQKNLN